MTYRNLVKKCNPAKLQALKVAEGRGRIILSKCCLNTL